ncbi:hypothetical protein EAD96_05200 [Micromonospora sp. BL1]|uniref:hypothetical protein n=1 Tax=Micromonospora sp. BL1 TaxID=2478709 RepID=UPI000EF5D3C7|nr:hypothetical protein [Micromonospora sp. BL1]RLQ08174.1 hypothetical protein EAD96_05200 [Micromonospora sp. BL1]
MTTAEKITLGVSIATALGVGALLKSLFDHFLSRPEKKATIAEKEVTIADKSVQIANAMMSRMDAELSRVQAALAKAEGEIEELRSKLDAAASKEAEAVNLPRALDSARATSAELSLARDALDDIQIEVKTYNSYNKFSDALIAGGAAEALRQFGERAQAILAHEFITPQRDDLKKSAVHIQDTFSQMPDSSEIRRDTPDDPEGSAGTPARRR